MPVIPVRPDIPETEGDAYSCSYCCCWFRSSKRSGLSCAFCIAAITPCSSLICFWSARILWSCAIINRFVEGDAFVFSIKSEKSDGIESLGELCRGFSLLLGALEPPHALVNSGFIMLSSQRRAAASSKAYCDPSALHRAYVSSRVSRMGASSG